MKGFLYFLLLICFLSCTTSNTIYEKPEGLIPKDTMQLLLTDMYIANSSKNIKNKKYKKKKNYLPIVYEKYKIDSTRFFISNDYYTSKIEDYNEMLEVVKKSIEKRFTVFEDAIKLEDSLKKKKKQDRLEIAKLKAEKKKLKNVLPVKETKIDTTRFYIIPFLKVPKILKYNVIYNRRR